MEKLTPQKTSVILYQNGKAKIQADNVEELVKFLFKGLKLQKKINKRFLKLGVTTTISVPTKNTKFMDLQKINASNFDEVQMLEAINFLNS